MTRQLGNYFTEDQLPIIRTTRDLPPAHYTFRIESFSSLATLETDYLESADFEVDGYKWKLLVYPEGNKKLNGEGHPGNKKLNGEGHLSMDLEFSESNKPSPGWEVHASFKFLVYDQFRDNYLTIQESGGRIRRFHRRKTKWGIDKLLPLQYLKNASRGYLVEDTCFFGAEIFVIKFNGSGESLSINKLVSNNTFTWKIHNFTTLDLQSYASEVFVMGDQKWKLCIHPKGYGNAKDKYVSLFLEIQTNPSLESGRKVYAEWILKVKDQIKGQDVQDPVIAGYFTSPSKCWGVVDMLSLSELNLPSNGYIKDNAMVVEIEFKVVSKVEDLPYLF